LRRRFDIKVCVSIATVQGTQVGNDIGGAFGEEHRHWLSGRRGFAPNQFGAILGISLKILKGMLPLSVNDRHFVATFPQSALLKIFDRVYLHG
jgi:hypothetical protein